MGYFGKIKGCRLRQDGRGDARGAGDVRGGCRGGGSAEMDIWLHERFMRELAASGDKVPASLLDGVSVQAAPWTDLLGFDTPAQYEV